MKTPDILKKTGGKAAEVVRQFTVRPDDDGVRLDRWFKRHLPDVGFATVSRWARTGQIRVDGKRAEVDTRLVAGQALRVPPGGALPPGPAGDKARKPLTEEEIAAADAMVMTQDRAAIILNKPPGLATQGGSGTFSHVDGLLDAYVTGSGPRPRLVHRLDKDTSGVLLVARTPGSAAFFSKQFAGRSTRKIYWALVVGIPEVYDGMIELPLSKQPGTGGEKMMVDESGEGQTARTRYRVIDRAGNSTAWVELQPLTGRTHQLRVHMAAIGHPIVGDGKYGGQGAFLTGSISRKMHLHARRLIIPHPEGDTLDVTAPLPDHFAASLTQLGFTESEGDLPLEDGPKVDPKVAEKRAARAHSRDVRRDRKGERRGRGADDLKRTERKPANRPGDKPVGKSGKPGGRRVVKAGAKPVGKPVGRPDGKTPVRRTAKAPSRPPRGA
ncbi:RluA family pseudouridine synthase [Novosphingobium sp.]|uniref:RluA family pseudouridine synthase n=1 Tax=Novosphingobium sp. TaxID=1874826 RepID=UPI003B5186BA